MKQQKRAQFSAYVLRLQRCSKMKNTEQSLENQALLKQISERRIYCETPEEAETIQETRGIPEVFLLVGLI